MTDTISKEEWDRLVQHEYERKRGAKFSIEINARLHKWENGKLERRCVYMTTFSKLDEETFNRLVTALKEKAFAIQIGEVCGHRHFNLGTEKEASVRGGSQKQTKGGNCSGDGQRMLSLTHPVADTSSEKPEETRDWSCIIGDDNEPTMEIILTPPAVMPKPMFAEINRDGHIKNCMMCNKKLEGEDSGGVFAAGFCSEECQEFED